MRAGGMAIAGGGMFVMAVHVQLQPQAEEVAAALREVGAAIPVIPVQVDEQAQAAGQPVR